MLLQAIKYSKTEVCSGFALVVLCMGIAFFQVLFYLLCLQVFEVPDGYRMVVTAGPAGGLTRHLVPLAGDTPTWEWKYSMGMNGQVGLEFVRNTPLDKLWGDGLDGQLVEANQQESVLDFTI